MDQDLLNVRTMRPIGTRLTQALKPLLPNKQSIVVDFDGLAQPGVLDQARTDSEELHNGTLTLDEARRRKGRKPLTPQQVDDWQSWFDTKKTQTEKLADQIAEQTGSAS